MVSDFYRSVLIILTAPKLNKFNVKLLVYCFQKQISVSYCDTIYVDVVFCTNFTNNIQNKPIFKSPSIQKPPFNVNLTTDFPVRKREENKMNIDLIFSTRLRIIIISIRDVLFFYFGMANYIE